MNSFLFIEDVIFELDFEGQVELNKLMRGGGSKARDVGKVKACVRHGPN